MNAFMSRHHSGTANAAFSARNFGANSTSNQNNFSDSDTVLAVSVFVISILRLLSIILNVINGIINRIIITTKDKYSKGNLKAAA